MSEKLKTPIKFSLEPDTKYAWCTCSHSEKQPFCDGSHRKHNATPSMVFEVEEKKDAWLCTCKKTKNAPYCDGSHNN